MELKYLSNDYKDRPNQHKMVLRYLMKRGIPLWIWWKVNGNWDTNMIRIFQWRESHCRTNSSVRRNRQIQKSRTVRITVWDLSRKVKHLRSFEIEELWQSSPDLSVPPEQVSQSLWKTLKSPKINTFADGLTEKTSAMLDETESKTVHKDGR